ncbi:MAG: hypothetical protein HQ546_07355, partial [Planctomycetes bacterium]|nr:hypothetical protein [Planctomycetota bacterium]
NAVRHGIALTGSVVPYLLAGLACLIGGAAGSGIGLAQTGIVLGFADGNGRSRYVAASSVLISLGGILGGLVGGTLAETFRSLQADPIRLGPFVWNNWHLTFAVALVARLSTMFWLVRMPDPKAAPVRLLARYLSANIYNGILTRLFYSLRVFGWQHPTRSSPRRDKPTEKDPRNTDHAEQADNSGPI